MEKKYAITDGFEYFGEMQCRDDEFAEYEKKIFEATDGNLFYTDAAQFAENLYFRTHPELNP